MYIRHRIQAGLRVFHSKNKKEGKMTKGSLLSIILAMLLLPVLALADCPVPGRSAYNETSCLLFAGARSRCDSVDFFDPKNDGGL